MTKAKYRQLIANQLTYPKQSAFKSFRKGPQAQCKNKYGQCSMLGNSGSRFRDGEQGAH